MKSPLGIAAAIAVILLIPTSVQASYHRYSHHQYRHHHRYMGDMLPHVAHEGGNVVSHKTGARATVGAAYAPKFQAYIDDLEAAGATIHFMGGIRRGHCWSGGMHPCGKALDVCQTSRGRVDSRCHLPNRQNIAAIAAKHGLFEGGQWCSSDYGHAQVGVSAAACGERTLMARSHYRHRTRIAAAAYYYPQYQYRAIRVADRFNAY